MPVPFERVTTDITGAESIAVGTRAVCAVERGHGVRCTAVPSRDVVQSNPSSLAPRLFDNTSVLDVGVAAQDSHPPPVARVPHGDGPVAAGAGESRAVGAEGDAGGVAVTEGRRPADRGGRGWFG